MGWNGAGLDDVCRIGDGWLESARMTDWQGIIRWALLGAVAIVLGLGCSGAAEPAPQAQPAAVPPTAPTVVGPADDLPAVFGRGLSLPDVSLPAVPVPDAPDLSGRFSEAASGLSGLVRRSRTAFTVSIQRRPIRSMATTTRISPETSLALRARQPARLLVPVPPETPTSR